MKTAPQSSVVDEAVFSILRRERLAAGGWIRLSNICRQWLLTGFRRSDLVEGLARLDTLGFLHLTGNDDDTFVIVRKAPPLLRGGILTSMRLLRRAKARTGRELQARDGAFLRRATDGA